jgi:hypothetical protein
LPPVSLRNFSHVKKSKEKLLIEKRLKLLAEFAQALRQLFSSEYEDQDQTELRSFINRNVMVVRAAVREAGTL